VAYVSEQTGVGEVYVRSLDGSGEATKVSQDGGQSPRWGESDGTLFFRSLGTQWVHSAQLSYEGGRAAVPEVANLFNATSFWTLEPGADFDVHPDGDRLIMFGQSSSKAKRSQLRIVENWFGELERLAPPAE
jgi:hypothetical protein